MRRSMCLTRIKGSNSPGELSYVLCFGRALLFRKATVPVGQAAVLVVLSAAFQLR